MPVRLDVARFTTVGVTARERVELARLVVGEFWGTPAASMPTTDLDAVERRLGRALAPPLRDGYERVLASPGMNGHDRFVMPASLVSENGYLVFRRENQGCAAWAVRVDDADDDPQVWLQVGEGPWVPDAGTVSSFFVFAALCEAVFGPPSAANAEADKVALEAVARHYRQLDLEPFAWWPSPRFTIGFYGGDDTLIVEHARTWLWAACLSPEALTALTTRVPAAWVRH